MSKVIPLNRSKRATTEGLVPSDEEFTLDTSSDEEESQLSLKHDDGEYKSLTDTADSSSDALPVAPPPITQGAESIVIHGKRVDSSEVPSLCCRKRIVPTSELTFVTAHKAVITCSDVKSIDILLFFLKTLADLAKKKSDIPSEILEKVKSEASVQQMIFDWTALLVLSRLPKESSSRYEVVSNSFQLILHGDLESGNEMIEVPMNVWVRVFDIAKEANVEIKALVKVKNNFYCFFITGIYVVGCSALIFCLFGAMGVLDNANKLDPSMIVYGVLAAMGFASLGGGLYFYKRAECAGGIELTDRQMLRQGNKKLGHPQVLRFIESVTEQSTEGKSDSEVVSPNQQ